jgi:acyl-CoA hydrolase
MDLAARIQNSRTSHYKMVFHNSVNDHETLFGGLALQWMDEVAYITATRFIRMHLATASVEQVAFLKPVLPGSILEIVGNVTDVGNVKIIVDVIAFVERIDQDGKERCIEARFCFAAINDEHKPVRLNFTGMMQDEADVA